MATIKAVKEQIQTANALGIANLTKKGVIIPENATTYDIMKAIVEISGSGGGVTYTNIVYNEDDTITLTDKDGVEHTMTCVYDDNKLINVTYDGKTIKLTYKGDALTGVGETNIDMSKAKVTDNGLHSLLDYTVKFYSEGELYEVVTVKQFHQVNKPTQPNNMFTCWKAEDGNPQNFPFVPKDNRILTASFDLSYSDAYYRHFNVRKDDYPYLFVRAYKDSYSIENVRIHFAKQWYIKDVSTSTLDVIVVNGDELLYAECSAVESIEHNAEGYYNYAVNNLTANDLKPSSDLTNDEQSIREDKRQGFLFTNADIDGITAETTLYRYGQIVPI